MLTKDLPVKVKAGPHDGLDEGTFRAYASVFGNVDSYGDVVVKGAFADDLERWKSQPSPIPLLFGHQMSDPDFNLGHIALAVEDDHGLLVEGVLDLDNPKSAQVYRMLKGGRINQLAGAYDVRDSAEATVDGAAVVELRKLKLYEVSLVTIGANQATEVLAVKAAADALVDGSKAGRVLAQKHIDSLRAAQDAIGAVIAAAEGDDQEKASGTREPLPNIDEPDGAKSEVDAAMPSPSVDVLAALIHITEMEFHHGPVHA